jgi:CrcB protein
MNVFTQAALVGAAGFVGAIVRYFVSESFLKLGVAFPVGTLVINVTGSLALGAMYGHYAGGGVPGHVRLLVAVGFLGAYTTFSTFAIETDALVRDGMASRAAVYVALSVVLGVAAARLGYVVMASRP